MSYIIAHQLLNLYMYLRNLSNFGKSKLTFKEENPLETKPIIMMFITA